MIDVIDLKPGDLMYDPIFGEYGIFIEFDRLRERFQIYSLEHKMILNEYPGFNPEIKKTVPLHWYKCK